MWISMFGKATILKIYSKCRLRQSSEFMEGQDHKTRSTSDSPIEKDFELASSKKNSNCKIIDI